MCSINQQRMKEIHALHTPRISQKFNVSENLVCGAVTRTKTTRAIFQL